MPEPRAHRITPTPKPDGCELDITGYTRDLLLDLIGLLRATPTVMDDLCALVDNPPPASDPFRPERNMPTEDFVERLCDLLPTGIRLHRPALMALGMRLRDIAAAQTGPERPGLLPVLPQQQDRRAS